MFYTKYLTRVHGYILLCQQSCKNVNVSVNPVSAYIFGGKKMTSNLCTCYFVTVMEYSCFFSVSQLFHYMSCCYTSFSTMHKKFPTDSFIETSQKKQPVVLVQTWIIKKKQTNTDVQVDMWFLWTELNNESRVDCPHRELTSVLSRYSGLDTNHL